MGLLSWPKGRRVYQDGVRLEYLPGNTAALLRSTP
jgi:hypothetical protein